MRAIRIVMLTALAAAAGPAWGLPRPDPSLARTWWAFQPLQAVATPAGASADGLSMIDALLATRLEDASGPPAPRAEPRALWRRAAFGLTGLPPTAEEMDAFAADPSPAAFARAVDQWLASPRYGEHWGRHWLDVVRYADTAGETADYPVPVAWRYRNYVIDAFNADKAYDDFLREQIAGDILARQGPREHYAERVTATGFLALSRRFGFDSENYHHLTIQDTIDTLGQSVLGLSLGCARCHDHTFDPVSMVDYYALYGIFESTRYAFPGSEQKQKYRALAPLWPPEESQRAWRAVEARTAALQQQLEGAGQGAPSVVLKSLNDIDGDFELQAPAAGGSNGVLVDPWIYEGMVAVTHDAQSPYRNVYASGRVGVSVPAGADDYAITQALHPAPTHTTPRPWYVSVDFRVAEGAECGRHRFALGSADGSPAVALILSSTDAWLQIGEAEHHLRPLTANQWHTVQLTLDLENGWVGGRIGRPDDMVAISPRPLPQPWIGGIARVQFTGEDTNAEARPAIAWDNVAVATDGHRSPETPATTTTVAADGSEATGASPNPEAPGRDPASELQHARAELEQLLVDGPVPLAYATSEGTPRHARLHRRGEPSQPGAEVPRGMISIFGGGPLPPDTPGSGRLELAEWLVGPASPLTARVMVNRIWQHHFGHGLVRTPNDFGVRGQPPEHPELLEFLAAEFIRGGWSVKAMHRLIMASAAYQQAAASPAESTPSIPRVARRRLTAEETRDAILVASGTLDPAVGEGHPFPSPLHWGFTQHAPFSAVYDHRQRSVYLMTQRIKRHPFLALFDGPDPNATTAERRTTTVPTQALYFLNDPFVHASADALAARVLAAATSEADVIVTAYRLALGRPPVEHEAAAATAFLAAYREELAASGVDASEQAVLAAFGRVLIGSNEFLTVE